jgi:hypothetical protein
MNAQEFMTFWRNELDCECMATGIKYALKRAKESARNLRKSDEITARERDAIMINLDAYAERCRLKL